MCENAIFTVQKISGFLPAGLPTSCLTTAPRFDMLKPADVSRKPLAEINGRLYNCFIAAA
jgi:hypothetical protein